MPAYNYLLMLLLLVSLMGINSQHTQSTKNNSTQSISLFKHSRNVEHHNQTGVRSRSNDKINPWESSLECPTTHPKVQWNLAGIPGDGYYISAQIGTPPQSVNLLVDTGSSNLAVAGANEATLDTFFKPNHSSSFVILNNTIIKVAYTQGWWEGELGSDVVVLPSLACHLQTRTFVALIRRSHSFYVAGSHWQGILGLAFPELAQPNKSVQPWFDSLLSAHNSTHQLVQQQQSLQEIVSDETKLPPIALQLANLATLDESSLEAPSTKPAPTSPLNLPLPRGAAEEGPSAIRGKAAVQTNENPSLSPGVVNKVKFVSNGSFKAGKSTSGKVNKNNIASFSNGSLGLDENKSTENKKSAVRRTKELHYFNQSYSIDSTTIRNVEVIKKDEGSGNDLHYLFPIKKTSGPESRHIFEVRTKQLSVSHLDNNEVTTVQSIVSHSTVTNAFNEASLNLSRIRGANLTTNLLNSAHTLPSGDGPGNRGLVPNTDNTSMLHNISNSLASLAVDGSNSTEATGPTDDSSFGHGSSVDDVYDASQGTLDSRLTSNSASDHNSDDLAKEALGAGGGSVLSNTFGMELCGPWSTPQHNTHHGRIMLGSLVDRCGDGPWFEAPILQPWFYEVAVTSMAVGGHPLDLPCTLYNVHTSIVDSGTTKLKLPDAVLEAVVSALDAAVQQQLPEPLPDNFWRGEGKVCWTDAHTAWSVLPILSIQIALSNYSSFSIELGPRSYLRPAPIEPESTAVADTDPSSLDDAVEIRTSLGKNSDSAVKYPTISPPGEPENTVPYGAQMNTDVQSANEPAGSLESPNKEVVGARHGTETLHSRQNTSAFRSGNSDTVIYSKDNAKKTVNDSLSQDSEADISTDTNGTNAEPESPKGENFEFVAYSRRKRSGEGAGATTGTLKEDSEASVAPPSPSQAAVPCWTVGIEPSNMGTVLGVVVLEGLCTRFDRGRGVLGFRRGRCGPVVSLKGPIPHDGAGSCVPGSGGAGTVVLASLLAVLCCPLLVFAIRWLVISFRRNAPRLRSSADAPFLTLDEAPNMFSEQ